MTLPEQLTDWLSDKDPETEAKREQLMIDEAPIGGSTLRAIKNGRYNPAPRLERAIRDVMAKHPKNTSEAEVATG